MSQSQWETLLDSIVDFLLMSLPYLLASVITSVAKYFSKHYGKEPFNVAIFIAKNLKAAFIGCLVACFCKGVGISPYIGVGVAATIISRGIDWFYGVVDDFIYTKLGIERRGKK